MANQKKIAVSLGFTADVSQAKSQLQQLQNSLTAITRATQDTNELGITGDLRNAAQAAAELQAHLQHATNVKTGTLDFGKLNRSIKQSGTSLQEYANTLVAMGPAGRTAFQQLATAVANSEIPLRRANVLVDELWDSLKKTAKWQLSSSAIHSLVGSFQTAYNYSKDLNKSLNDIRIVSQKSSDEMARFATQANKAAKSLSSSTLDYTEAALIYYQQGLSDEQIKQRTDTTIKMANVTGENAENVSSYMTAIWNNFAKGSEDLEYYADVITALGAATASSSEEIAGGLEKFAAIGETVGLSYEYATSALATVVAATRQSEDIVGTSFKTLFARIQGLQQGEEQEDGVTLNKYSQALANVGINVLNANGELKKMDDILNELGNKWTTISESQQVALAQTVGGTRQYTQLISLMDNWEQFQKNLNTAYNAEGSLEQQSQIYEESWQAASKRVQTALESIYDKLINDDGFIALLNVAEDFLNVIDRIIDGVGGLGGVLSSLGAIATQVFGKQMAQGINDMAYSLKMSTEGGRRAELAERTQVQMGFNQLMAAEFEEAYGNSDPRVTGMKRLIKLEEQLLKNASTMSEVELRTNQALYDRYLIISRNAQTAKLERNEAEQSYRLMVNAGHSQITAKYLHDNGTERDWVNNGGKSETYKQNEKNLHSQYSKIIADLKKNLEQRREIENGSYANKRERRKAKVNNSIERNRLRWDAESLGVTFETTDEFTTRYKKYLELKEKAAKLTAEEKKEYKALYKYSENPEQRKKDLEDYNRLRAKGNDLTDKERERLAELQPIYENATQKQMSFGEAAVKTGQMFSSLSAVVHSVKGMIDVLENEDLTIGEKFLSISSSVGMLIPQMMMLTSSFAALASETGKSTLAQGIHTVAVMLGAEAADAATLKTLTLSAAMDKLKTGFLKFLPAVLPILLKLALLAGAIFLVVKAFETFKANTPEGKLEALTKKSEEAAKAARDIVGAYQDLNSELDSLKNKQDALSELTKGTLEYRLAIAELNQQLIDFLDKYDLWDRATVEMKDGVMTITNQESLFNDILEKRANAIEIANANSLTTNLEKAKQATFNEAWSENIIDLINLSAQKKTIVVGSKNQDNTDAHGAESQKDQIPLSVNVSNETISNEDTMEFYKRLLADENSIVATENGYELNISDESIEHLVKKGYDADSLKTTFSNALSDQETLKSLYSNAIEYQSHGLTEESNFNLVGSKVAGDWVENNDYNSGALQNLLFTGIGEAISERKNELLKTITISPEMREEYLRIRGIDPDSEDAKKVTADEMKGYFAQKQAEEEMTDSKIAEYASKISINSIKAIENSEKELSLSEEQLESRREAIGFSKDDLELKKKIIKESKKYSDELEDNEELLEHIAISEEEMAHSAEDIPEAWEKVAKEIENGTTSSKEFIQGLNDVKDAFADVLDTSQWDSDFMIDHLDIIKKAAEGDIKAMEQLAAMSFEKSTQAYLQNNELTSKFSQEIGTKYLTGYQDFVTGFQSIAQSVPIGETVDVITSTWGQGLNTFLKSTEMTTEQVQELFNGMGFIPEIKEIKVKQEYMDTNGEVQTKVVKVPQIVNLTKAGFTSYVEGITRGSDSSGGSKKDKKNAAEEIDRYHVIKEQIQDIEQELDRISEAKDRAFGGDKLKLMDEEIAKTKEMAKAQEEYLRQINANYGPDRAVLEKYGAKFDANGALINYDSLMNAQINKFNASLTDEAEEEFNNFKELIEQYEETDDLLAEERQKLTELQNEIFDLMLEKLEYSVDLKVDVSDDSIKYLEFLNELAGDGMDKAVDKIGNLGTIIGKNMDKIAAYNEGLNQMFANRGYKGNIGQDLKDGKVTPEELAEMYDLTEAEVDLLRDYMGNIMDITKEIQNMRKEITDQLIDAMEEINEKFDEQIDKINRAAEGMQHYRDIIDLVGQDVLGISDEMVEMFSEKQLNNSIANVSATRTKMLENEREYNEAVAELERLKDTGASEFAIEEQERVVEAAREHLYDSTDEFNSTWKDALEQAREHFDLTIEQITSAFEEAMSGIYGNLEALQDAYDRQSEINERYLEDYEKIYELSKLNRDIGNSIDNTDSVRAKQALLELQEEINALEESGAEISKYDLDFLRQKYELRLAEIALEEAQNAKNQVRMTRDSEGNWNYTYTANEENISKAEQDYEDALYKTQQLTTDYIKDLENRIFQLNTDLVNALSNIDPNDAEGRQRIYDYYMGQNAYLTSQLNNALGNNADIYNQDWINYSNATGYKISDNEKWMDSFNETTLSMLTGFSTLGDYQTAFRDNSLSMYNGINEAAATFAKNTAEVMEIAGASIENFAKDAQDAFLNPETGFVAVTNQATDSIKDIDTEAKTAFDSILLKLQQFNKDYDKQIQETIKINNSLIESLNNLIAKEAEAKKSSGGSSSNNTTNNNPGTTSTVDEPAPEKEIWYNPIKSGSEYIEGNCIYQNYIQKSSWGRTRPADRKLVRVISGGGRAQSGAAGLSGGIGSQHSMVLMDTGGYTGAWGTTAGKLAMLHEKELVLNKQDTENILQSVNLVRQISDWISGRVNAMQYGSMLSAFGLPGDNKNVLEQMVTIHAEFPNANNRAEIEAAFDNLVNRAAQYAYRK